MPQMSRNIRVSIIFKHTAGLRQKMRNEGNRPFSKYGLRTFKRWLAIINIIIIIIIIIIFRQHECDAEPRWPSGNTLAFNAEDPGSMPGPGVR